MAGLFQTLKDTALQPVRTAVSHLVEDVIEIALIAILALLAAAFGIAALYIWLSERYGELHAAGYMAGIFLVLAILVVIFRVIASRSRAKKAEKERREMAAKASDAARSALDVAALLKSTGLGGERENIAARVAHSVTSQVSPWTLIGLSVLAGFIGGRVLDKNDD